MPLPPVALRWGGSRYHSDEEYLRSARKVARRVIDECGLTRDSRLLDIGCGQGRLLRGVIGELGCVGGYLGLDVHEPSVEWLRSQVNVGFAEFRLLHFRNDRYNPSIRERELPDLGERFEAVVLISVFSHMRLDDISTYLRFIRKSMAENARAFLTAFVEDDVPAEEENPVGYIAPSKGPLHRVRLNRQHFEKMVREAGLQVSVFRYAIHDGQSVYVLTQSS